MLRPGSDSPRELVMCRELIITSLEIFCPGGVYTSIYLESSICCVNNMDGSQREIISDQNTTTLISQSGKLAMGFGYFLDTGKRWVSDLVKEILNPR